jgi:hypothetical protein
MQRWLISIEDHHVAEFVTLQKQMEANLHEITVMREAVSKAMNSKVNKTLKEGTVQEPTNQGHAESVLNHIMLPTTCAMAKQPMDSKSISIKPRKHQTINKSKHQLDEDVGDHHHEDRSTFEHNRIK